ncbi:MAG TPA: ROK family protein, partial [Anaerolineaceae bacterium]|nr:ROK family protein [Anaerolineaceae bacterium]
DLAYIKIGIGVGSGLVINHQIYRGESGTAGEIGHTTIEVDGRLCRCGNHGCMEAYVGGPGLLADAQAALQAAHRGADEMPGTVEDLVDTALQGDAVCRQVIQNAGRYLGTSIANLLNLVNPGLVILGGELVQAGELLMGPIHASIRERVMPIAAQQAAIVAGKLGNDAIAIGAATLVIQNAFEPTQLAKTLNGRQAAQVYS